MAFLDIHGRFVVYTICDGKQEKDTSGHQSIYLLRAMDGKSMELPDMMDAQRGEKASAGEVHTSRRACTGER